MPNKQSAGVTPEEPRDAVNEGEAMPKEAIYNYYARATPDGLDVHPEYLHVGWTPGMEHVEVASVQPNGKIYLLDEQAKEYRDINAHTPGWFVQLDRAGINAMIRALRKARDSAFGSDE
jgi:hypothetical protein